MTTTDPLRTWAVTVDGVTHTRSGRVYHYEWAVVTPDGRVRFMAGRSYAQHVARRDGGYVVDAVEVTR
ncbi:MAG: hypothetical protein QM655_17170 [Nocardioidaceae bacterium]